MTKINYLRSTTKFWNERKVARNALDKARSNSPRSVQIDTATKLSIDAAYLRSGKVVGRKSAIKCKV